MWHSSAMASALTRNDLRKRAFRELEGVGDKTLGQWEEWTGNAYHVRRRLTADEEKITGPVVDIRGTREALERVERLLRRTPFLARGAVFEEAGLKIVEANSHEN